VAIGDADYLFHEIQRGIDDRIWSQIEAYIAARVVALSTPREALQYLIDEGVISSNQARGDL
jgi:hypothetical protein